jgi:hypothetical protein
MFQRRLRAALAARERGETGMFPVWQGHLGWEAHARHAATGGLRASLLAGVRGGGGPGGRTAERAAP